MGDMASPVASDVSPTVAWHIVNAKDTAGNSWQGGAGGQSGVFVYIPIFAILYPPFHQSQGSFVTVDFLPGSFVFTTTCGTFGCFQPTTASALVGSHPRHGTFKELVPKL